MSAIFGMLRFDAGVVARNDLERMANGLAHRGPDGRRFVARGAVGLGQCLMRVNVEDRFEAQPLHDPPSDVTLVADCRIDNRDELAGIFGISAAELSTTPDSALILRAYKQWGDGCAAHLLGDFTFAVWNGREQTLLLARDHTGQRYVHYYRNRAFFAFATEIKALWMLRDVRREVNEDQLGRFLLADLKPRDGATLFRDIFGLPGGSTMAVRRDGARDRRRYWRPAAAREHVGHDESYYVEHYRGVLAAAVKSRVVRLIAPPALCFSAGYDSAAIAGLCGPLFAGQNNKLIAVSSVLPEGHAGGRPDVRPWVETCRRAMPYLDVRYVVHDAGLSERQRAASCMIADDIPFVFDHVLQALYRTAAAAGARLVMDGIGGDLTINPRGGMALASFLRRGRLVQFFRELAAYRRGRERRLLQILRSKVAFPLAPMWARRAWLEFRRLDPVQLRRFVAPQFAQQLKNARAVDPANMPMLQSRAHMRRTSARSLREMADAPRSHYGNEAAACGLDLTRPMLDRRVVEFGLAVPEDLYVVKGRRRHLARRALAGVYPHEYQSREEDQDWLDPGFIETFRGASPQICAQLQDLRGDPTLRRYFSLDALADIFGNARAEAIPPAIAAYALRAFQAAAYVRWLGTRNE